MELKKMSKTAAKLGTFFKVVQKIILISEIVMICLLIALSIANAVNPNVVISTNINEIDLGAITLEVEASIAPSNGTILRYAWFCAALAVAVGAIVWFALSCIRKILAPVAEGRPFHPDTAKELKKLAYLSLGLGVVDNVGSFAETFLALNVFGLDQLQQSQWIHSITINYTLELGCIVVFFLLLLMSYIFTYGAQLQQLSDETL